MTLAGMQEGETDALERAAQAQAGAHHDWAEFVGRNLCRFTIRTQAEPSFQIGARVRESGGFLVGRFTTVAGHAKLDRSAREIGIDGQDRYALYLPLKGEHEIAQIGRSTRSAPLSMTLVTLSEPLSQTKLGDNDTVYFFMPRMFVEQRLADGAQACARAVAANDGLRRLAHDTMVALSREAALMSRDDFGAATRTASELLVHAFAGVADLMSSASAVRAGNLARAKRIMRARLADPELSLADVARACGLSLRYLHDLFRDDGRTAQEFLTMERLERARRMLAAAEASARPVTDVSMACGFSSPSQFATSFRRAFGVSPRELARR